MKLVLLVNATASAVTDRTRQAVEEALGERHELAVVVTRARGHATDLAREAAAGGADALVVLGGDGTLNEAANGLDGTATTLAPLPGGSTNVFARTIGLANRPVPAARQVVGALEAGSTRRVPLGRAGGRGFLFHLGVGYDAAVVQHVERHGGLKRWLGHGLFVYSALATWAGHDARGRPPFRVVLPGGEQLEGYLGLFLESDPYTFLGPRPFTVAPGASHEDGLAVVVLQDLAATTLVGAAVAALAGGHGLADRPHVATRTGLASVRVEADRPVPHQVDGDYLGDVTSLEVTHQPDRLALVVPLPVTPG